MRPEAGELMAVFCAVVMRGGRNPVVVDVRSRSAELSGVEVPTAILPVFEMSMRCTPAV